VTTWLERVDVNSLRGTPQSALTALQQCQDACEEDPRCVAVDWNRSPRPGETACWQHLDAGNLLRRYNTLGVTQYELTNRCATTQPATTTTAPGPIDARSHSTDTIRYDTSNN